MEEETRAQTGSGQIRIKWQLFQVLIYKMGQSATARQLAVNTEAAYARCWNTADTVTDKVHVATSDAWL